MSEQIVIAAEQFPAFLAFHGSQEIKDFYLERVRWHRKKDHLIQGTGWNQQQDGVFRGCAIGCSLERYDHQQYEDELGVPIILARLQDKIFESLPQKEAMAWPEQFLSATMPGADLSMVWPKIALWLLTDEQHGVVRLVGGEKFSRQKAAIEAVAALYRRWVAGDRPADSEFRQAAAAAADAAYAADATAGAAARSQARAVFWTALRDRLLLEIAAAPILAVAY